MRIAIVANNLRAGGGRIVMNNLLPKLLPLLAAHETIVVLPFSSPLSSKFKGVKFIVSGGKSAGMRFLWQKTVMEPKIRQFRPDWTFMMGNYAIRGLSGRQTMLFHNPNLYDTPSIREHGLPYWARTKLKQIQLRRSLSNIDRIYFQSEVIKKYFLNFYTDYKKDSQIMPMFVPDDMRNVDINAEKGKDDGIFRLCYVAKTWPHKNHEIIIETFKKYPQELKNIECTFTFAPNESNRAKALCESISKNNLKDRIKCVGELDRKDISELYRASDALIMPTKLETLGLPYLEAMYYGIPIITTDADFSHVVCGNAALYVNSKSTESIRDAILQMRDDAELRKKLIDNGQRILDTKVKSPSQIAKAILELEEIQTA